MLVLIWDFIYLMFKLGIIIVAAVVNMPQWGRKRIDFLFHVTVHFLICHALAFKKHSLISQCANSNSLSELWI